MYLFSIISHSSKKKLIFLEKTNVYQFINKTIIFFFDYFYFDETLCALFFYDQISHIAPIQVLE